MTAAFDVEAETRKAMARPLSGRFAGTSRTPLPTPAEIDRYLDGYERYSIRDEPFPEGLLAEGEAQDAAAEQVGCHEFDPDDRFDRVHVPDWSDAL